MEIKELRQKIHKQVVHVTFKKKNGDIREMNCTTKMSAIPENKRPANGRVTNNNNQVTVFDTDLGEWRSFLFESVMNVA